MSNQEKQADEVLVLQSMFEKNFRLLDDNQYEILIEFELISPIQIQFNHQISTIEYLPPFTLIIQYHDEYPSDEPPSYILSCFYFSKHQLQKLCEKLDQYLFTNEVCIYNWIDLIKGGIDQQWNFDIQFPEEKNDPRVLNGYTNENAGRVFQYLIEYNQEYLDKQFQNQIQTCLICSDTLPGGDCLRLRRCGHFYCQSCLNQYVQMTLNNGQFGEKIICPENDCQQALLPTEIKQILQNNQLYERYERITLQDSLASMNDIVWCPRCQSAVLIDQMSNDNLAICDGCRYTFCRKCREIFHSQTMCPKEYVIEQLRLQQEKERQRIQKQREEALAQLEKSEAEKKTALEKKVAKEKYQQIVIKLSEENALLEEIMNAERMDALNTQQCPQCHVRIEKNGGCSHMHCSRCNFDFTWKEIPIVDIRPGLLKDWKELESARDELYKTANLVKTSNVEEKEKLDSDEKEEEMNRNISIDNRSVFGSAIVRRVKQCSSKSCKKLNVKIGQDNWMVCSACMKQYCFLCGGTVQTTKHYEKKCQRYTPI